MAGGFISASPGCGERRVEPGRPVRRRV